MGLLKAWTAGAAVVWTAFGAGIADWDPNMAVEGVTAVDGVKWIDGTRLPIEGRAFDEVEHYYDRLPAKVTEAVNSGVREMKHHTAGMQLRFKTDSSALYVRWIPYEAKLQNYDNLTDIAANGLDVYRRPSGEAVWRYVGTGRITDPNGSQARFAWTPGDECLVNLPLYNGIRSLAVGIDEAASLQAPSPHASGIVKPVVFYGTSITQGASASRPGRSFVNVIGRALDVPIVNLGFSGSGVMELEMSDHLSAIDASCYVIDSLWNVTADQVRQRYEPFVRNLRAKRPNVPIVLAGRSDVFGGGPLAQDDLVRAIYEKLVAEGWTKLSFIPKTGMYDADGEGSIDGIHPNDTGMASMARVYGRTIRKALGLVPVEDKGRVPVVICP